MKCKYCKNKINFLQFIDCGGRMCTLCYEARERVKGKEREKLNRIQRLKRIKKRALREEAVKERLKYFEKKKGSNVKK